jgi:hypothetical protein
VRASLSIGVLLSLLACDADGGPSAMPPSGTYALKVCRGSCNAASGGQVLEEGQLVLLEEPLDVSRLSRGAQFLLVLDGDLTACWVAKSGVAPAHADGPVGGSVWSRDSVSGAIRFKLWQTVDTHDAVSAYLRGDSIVGRGRLHVANEGGLAI